MYTPADWQPTGTETGWQAAFRYIQRSNQTATRGWFIRRFAFGRAYCQLCTSRKLRRLIQVRPRGQIYNFCEAPFGGSFSRAKDHELADPEEGGAQLSHSMRAAVGVARGAPEAHFRPAVLGSARR